MARGKTTPATQGKTARTQDIRRWCGKKKLPYAEEKARREQENKNRLDRLGMKHRTARADKARADQELARYEDGLPRRDPRRGPQVARSLQAFLAAHLGRALDDENFGKFYCGACAPKRT